MSDTVISVENLGKRYRLRLQEHERYIALRDVLANRAKNLFCRNGRDEGERQRVFRSQIECIERRHECLKNIAVEDVFEVCAELVGEMAFVR